MNLICPRCLNHAVIRLEVGDGDTLTCAECEEEFSLTDVVNMVESWKPLLPWLCAHPARVEASAETAVS